MNRTLFTFATLVLAPLCISAQAPATTPAVPATQQQTKPAAVDDLPDSPSTSAQITAPPEPNGPKVVFDTTMGRMVCQFYQKEAPMTVANFIGLAEGTKEFMDPTTGEKKNGVRFYDGTTFHRVIPHFMIQGGDRLGTGAGDPGYMFGDEFNKGLRFDRSGRLAMANAGPGTNGSQFFITEDAQDELNGKHTIFGQCDAHAQLIEQSIARVDRDSNDKPITPVVINKVTIVREGQSLPPEPAPAQTPAAAASPAQ
ncbi:MAG: peptidylprolyl isomerase [Acidobacteria bacterium]|nr:peptidylprolyl isomerase [Acidobacteriota bacterium]